MQEGSADPVGLSFYFPFIISIFAYWWIPLLFLVKKVKLSLPVPVILANIPG
jgi:hypothetical protein